MSNLALRRLAPLLALLAVLATACSSVTGSAAMTVEGTEFSQDDLQDELELIRGNSTYRNALEQQYGVELAGTGQGTFSAAFAAQALSLRAYYELLDQDLAEKGVEITDADVDEALEALREQAARQESQTGEDIFAGFPDAFVRRLAREEALVAKAAEHAAAQAEAPDDVEIACVSHILFSTESRSEAEALRLAEEAKAAIDGGADFAEVARERSEDPGSGAQGGELGCNPPGRFVEAFDAAAFEQEVGVVGEPVQSEFGYHVILVTERELGPDPQAGGEQEALNAYLVDLICNPDLDVDVNPRYGRWDRSPCEQGGLARVAPPRTSSGS